MLSQERLSILAATYRARKPDVEWQSRASGSESLKKFAVWLPLGFVLALLGMAVLFGLSPAVTPTTEIAFSEFKDLVAEHKVEEVTFRDGTIDGTLFNPMVLRPSELETRTFRTRIPAIGDPGLMAALEEADVRIAAGPAEGVGWGWLGALLPWVVLFGVYFWLWPRMFGNLAGGMGSGQMDRFLRGSGKAAVKETPKVTFDDVAGQENAKREVAELVDFLRNPQRYRKLGAEPPRGILLMGAPGTGKTLLAKALAGEADVPFFSISASEFIEVFVGVGASRVRNLFAEAKKSAPAIVFIDELDSIGRVRGTGRGGGNDEREQTLNQILAELDGFAGHEAVVVLAATNRPDVLDPALLRPGRFDRHITLELPDKKARLAILQVHVRNVPLSDDVDLEAVAKGTPGFSGAELHNLVNEAAMMAARENQLKVSQCHFEAMRERVIMGSERTLALRPEEKHRLAVHESGHAVAAFFLPQADPLFKVSIVPRGRSLGATQQLPEGERYIMDEPYVRSRIAVMLGGRAAERAVFGTVSSGADDDIHQATALARMMVSRWGMDDKIGPMDVRESEEHPFLGRSIAQPRQVSESTAHKVDHAIREILGDAEQAAEAVIEQHRAVFDRLAAALEESETLDRENIESLLRDTPAAHGNVVPISPKA